MAEWAAAEAKKRLAIAPRQAELKRRRRRRRRGQAPPPTGPPRRRRRPPWWARAQAASGNKPGELGCLFHWLATGTRALQRPTAARTFGAPQATRGGNMSTARAGRSGGRLRHKTGQQPEQRPERQSVQQPSGCPASCRSWGPKSKRWWSGGRCFGSGTRRARCVGVRRSVRHAVSLFREVSGGPL